MSTRARKPTRSFRARAPSVPTSRPPPDIGGTTNEKSLLDLPPRLLDVVLSKVEGKNAARSTCTQLRDSIYRVMTSLKYWTHHQRPSVFHQATAVPMLPTAVLSRCAKRLITLDCSSTTISDLSPLRAATVLQHLDCSGTNVLDLAPLAALKGLQSLDFRCARVSDLSPLAALTGLTSMHCFNTKVWDLGPLKALTGLEELSIRICQVDDLTPLSGLSDDLTPLAGLTGLMELDCMGTQVSDLRSQISDLRSQISAHWQR